jgi:uncharacterized protein (TIGR01440 family)
MTSGLQIEIQVETCLRELVQVAQLTERHLVVIGTSTSEVIGKHIGTQGSLDAARQIYAAVTKVRQDIPFHAAFQCCEHLNRALVVEKASMEQFGLEEVSVIPVPAAGGSMATYAYRQLKNPCVVETIQAHAGIDIGDTLIGMHLRPVAIPIRPSIRQIGEAHVTMARTRPKLIGGSRAEYEPTNILPDRDQTSCS